MVIKSYPRLDFSRMPGYDLQEEIIQSKARFKVVAIGRQAGKSWLAKRLGLEKGANEGKRVWWVAPTLSAAQDHWEELLFWLEAAKFPVKKINLTLKQVSFHSGGSIRIRTAEDPKLLRGGTLGYLILDECAFMAKEVWYAVLQATISTSRGEVLFLSTPNGRNWFYDIFKMGGGVKGFRAFAGWQSWNAPSTVSPYQDKELLEQIRLTSPKHVWEQEYLAMFLEDSGGVFLKVSQASTGLGLNAPLRGQVYVAGIDWGGVLDATTFTVLDKYKREQVYGKLLLGEDNDDQIDALLELLDIWQPETTAVEKNGVGEPMFNILRKRMLNGSRGYYVPDDVRKELGDDVDVNIGGHKARGFSMSNPLKRKIIEELSVDIEFGRIVLLSEIDECLHQDYAKIQIAEMSTFKRKKTDSGLNITYAAAEGYHDDTVMSLALAYHLIPKYRPERLGQKFSKAGQNKPARRVKNNPFRR